MTRLETSDFTVLGCGVAGAAIAYELMQRQAGRVTVLYQQALPGSSMTNQKWKHSGLFYSRRELARELWDAFEGMHELERQRLQQRGGVFLFEDEERLAEIESLWQQWELAEWGARVNRCTTTEGNHPALGPAACAGGWHVPDSVLDFPALLETLRERLRAGGARVVPTASVTELIRDGDRLDGVIYQDGSETVVHRSRCVIAAMGAWSLDLLAGIGVRIPMCRWKSHVLTCEEELVGQITAWMDGRQLRLVPFQGRTIIHDGRVEAAEEGGDLAPSAEGSAALRDELAARFPALNTRVLAGSHVHACIKTEEDDGLGGRSRSPRIYTARGRPGTPGYRVGGHGTPGHGVEGLVAAFPGKASLMFPLAREAVRVVVTEDEMHKGP